MRYTSLLLIFIFICINISGQPAYYIPTGSSSYISTGSTNWYSNLEKYWYYRYKLVNDFMLIGPNAGMSEPVYKRDLKDGPTGPGFHTNCLDFSSDATIDLGHYIGMLACEYELLNNNGFNTGRTLYELTYAQNALKRLTNNSAIYEYGLTSGGGGIAYYPGIGVSNPTLIPSMNSNAMFLRDDCPYLTFTQPSTNLQNWKHFNRSGIAPLANPTSVLLDEREVRNASGAFDGHYFGYNPFDPSSPIPPPTGGGYNVPNCESQDQLQVIFDGEALVQHYVPGTYQTDAEDYITKLIHWTSNGTGPHSRPFYSIPDVLNPSQCAKLSCGNSGMFFFSAPPATKCEANLGNNLSLGESDMGTADNPYTTPLSTVAFLFTGGYACYPLLFEIQQYVPTECLTTYISNDFHISTLSGLAYEADGVTYADGYVAFANDWTITLPPSPLLMLMPIVVSTNLLSFAHSNDPLSPWVTAPGPLNTSWPALSWHAEGDNFGTPHYPLMWEIMNGALPWESGPSGKIEPLLTSAPPCGPYNYEARSGLDDFWNTTGSSYASTDWNGNDRLDDPYHRQGWGCYGDNHYDCEFNGLDYMFLFDLYNMRPGSSYLGGMMNSYYMVDYNVNYPSSGVGSYANKLKLNWLEYLSAIDIIYSGSSSSTNGWVDFRGAQVIDLKPNTSGGQGFWAQKGCFFLAHIKDYNCNGGNIGDGPYEFAELNPTPPDYGPEQHHTDTGWREIVYIPNGQPFVGEKPLTPDPSVLYADSLMNVPGTRDLLLTCYKYLAINSIDPTDTDLLDAVKQHFNWNDDTIAKYRLHIPLASSPVTISIAPNPTSGSSTLSYSIPTNSSIQIRLTNAVGQDFSELLEHYDPQCAAGTYNCVINSERLTPGLYIVTLFANDQMYTAKLSVIK